VLLGNKNFLGRQLVGTLLIFVSLPRFYMNRETAITGVLSEELQVGTCGN